MLTPLFVLTIVLTILFMILTPPLMMSILVIFQALCLALSLFFMAPSAWFSFLIIMVFVSGMMIIFIYVASLTPNPIFKPSPLLIILLALPTAMTIVALTYKPWNKLLSFLHSAFKSQPSNWDPCLISPPYTFPVLLLSLFFMFYLLLTLFVVVKNTTSFKGPLRLNF